MFLRDGIGMGMDAFPPLEGDGYDGDIDGAGYADPRPDLDCSFNARLRMGGQYRT